MPTYHEETLQERYQREADIEERMMAEVKSGQMVSVPRELLGRWADKLDGSDSVGYGREGLLSVELRAILAQPVADEQAEQQPAVWATHPKGAAVDADCGLVGAEEAKNYAPGCVTPLYAAPIAQAAPSQADENLIASARALLSFDKQGKLAPHGIGGMAREIITKLIERLGQTAPQPEQSGLVEALQRIIAADWTCGQDATDSDISRLKDDLIWDIKRIARAALSDQGGGQ